MSSEFQVLMNFFKAVFDLAQTEGTERVSPPARECLQGKQRGGGRLTLQQRGKVTAQRGLLPTAICRLGSRWRQPEKKEGNHPLLELKISQKCHEKSN